MPKSPKWNGPQGSDDMEKDKLRKDDSALGYHRPVDIEKRVNEAWKIDDGFSGKLPKGD